MDGYVTLSNHSARYSLRIKTLKNTAVIKSLSTLIAHIFIFQLLQQNILYKQLEKRYHFGTNSL